MPQTITTICPVCGFKDLEVLRLNGRPYLDGSICDSCGTEFGFSDYKMSYAELRTNWISKGAKWWNPSTPKPLFWSPSEQLRNINYQMTDADKIAIANGQGTNTQTVRLGISVKPVIIGDFDFRFDRAGTAEIIPFFNSSEGQVFETPALVGMQG